MASQYHPEFKSRPERPAPLFREFVGAAVQRATAADSTDEADDGPAAEANGERATSASSAFEDISITRGSAG